jgi:D-beta-D-heptose 7-phosphate kinase/D-beta-D-heptose 1-phosphate adenosyltransferase
VRVVGVVGEDELGGRLLAALEARGADVSGVVRDESRPTTHKMRILAGRQQLLRVDTELAAPLSGALAGRLREELRASLSEAEVVLVSDYAKGVVSEESLPGELIAAAREAEIPLCGDPKPENMEVFRGAYLVSPNEAEALEAVGPANSVRANASSPAELPPEVMRAGRVLRERLRAEAVFITRGDQGIAVFVKGEGVRVAPAISISHSPGATAAGDGTGCGDAASAASALALAAGADLWEAAELANAAGWVVSRFVGVYFPAPAEIMAAFGGLA